MLHEHVCIAVHGASVSGVEYVPAMNVGSSRWQLLKSPLYGLGAAAGDLIEIIDPSKGLFTVLKRGDNVVVQFYMARCDRDSLQATQRVAVEIEAAVGPIGGKIDGVVAGLIVSTIPVSAGFSRIESVFDGLVRWHQGGQWQYGNVYDPITEEPLNWWS